MSGMSIDKKTVDVRPESDQLSQRLRRYARYGVSYLSYYNQPSIWPAITRKIRDKLLGRIPSPAELKRMKEEGAAWCATRQTSTVEGLAKLGITSMIDVEQKFPNIFAHSVKRAGAVPVWQGGGSNLNLLYTLCQHFQPMTIVESGVANGWSSLTFLLYLMERERGALYSTDLPILELRNDEWIGIAVPHSLRDKWHLYRMADHEGLPQIALKAAPFDFIYYDSHASEKERLEAFSILWESLRPGGVFIADDIDNNMAFAYFCKQVGVKPVVVKEPERNAQGFLIKP